MTFLALIERELRLRARSQATYWVRFAVALAGVLLCVQQLILTGPLRTPAVVGRQVFNEMTGAAFLLCCGACLLAVEAIHLERREGTLGLLFLTRVRSFDVLAGKLASVGTTSLCALVALVPALMIPVLAGGVTLSEAFRTAAGLAATLLFALGAGLCGAAAQPQRFKAACGALLIVLVAALGPFMFFKGASSGLVHYAGLLSPLVLMIAAGNVAYQAAPAFYWGSLAAVQILGWLLLAGASLRLRRSIGRDGGAEVVRPPPPPKDLERAVGLGRWRPDKAEAGPIEWLVYRQRGVSAAAWAAAVAALTWGRCVSLASKPVIGANMPIPVVFLVAWPLGLASALVGGAMAVWIAGRFFASVRRTGELELLLPTPLGAEHLVADQWKVLKRMFVWPVLFLQVAMLVPLAEITGSRSIGFSPALPLESALAVLLNFANTFLGTGALCWLGLWFGLTARRPTNAILYAVGLAQGVPWLVSLITVAFGAVSIAPGRVLPAPYAMVSWLPEAAILVFYVWLWRLAERGLADKLAGREPLPFQPGRQTRPVGIP